MEGRVRALFRLSFRYSMEVEDRKSNNMDLELRRQSVMGLLGSPVG